MLGGSLDPVAHTLTVPVSSSSPGPTAAAGRRTQNARARGNLGPYGSVHIEPGTAVVPVRGRLTLSLNFVGPSSTSSSSRGFFALVPGGVQVDDIRWDAIFGTIQGAGTYDAVYTAPNCLPRYNPVSILAHVRASGGSHFPNDAIVHAQVRIVERDWAIQTTYVSRSLCSLGFIWSLEYSRSHNGAFSLDDDGKVIDYVPGLNHDQTFTPAWCPGFDPQGCSQLTLTGAPIGDLIVNNVDGRLLESLQGPAFDLTLTAEIPGTGATVSFTCPGHDPFVYLIPHAAPPVVVQPLLVHDQFGTFEETRDFFYPGWIESARIVLTPIKPAGSP
jgi:hypothetical protein